MRIEVEFPVVTSGMLAKQRTPKAVFIRCRASVEVPDICSADAPVAAVVTAQWDADPKAEGVAYRRHNGRMFVRIPDVQIDQGLIKHVFDLETSRCGDSEILGSLNDRTVALLERLLDKHGSALAGEVIPRKLGELRLSHRSFGTRETAFVLPEAKELDLAFIDEGKIAEQTERFRSHLKRFVTIDGFFHMEVKEPIYRLNASDHGGIGWVGVEELPWEGRYRHPEGTAVGTRFLRGDTPETEIEPLFRKLEAVLADGRVRNFERRGRIHLLDADAVSFDAESANIGHAGQRVLHAFQAANAEMFGDRSYANIDRFLMSMDPRNLAAYQTIKHALDSHDTETVADTLPILRRFLLERAKGGQPIANLVDAFLDDWVNRPVPPITLEIGGMSLRQNPR